MSKNSPMIDDEKIIEMFFERSEQGIRELDIKYGKICHNLSYNIVNSRQDAEECVNDAYLGAWNAIPPTRPNPLLSYIVKIVRNISMIFSSSIISPPPFRLHLYTTVLAANTTSNPKLFQKNYTILRVRLLTAAFAASLPFRSGGPAAAVSRKGMESVLDP